MLHASVFSLLTVLNALTLLISPWSHPSGPSQSCLTTGFMVNPEDSENKRLGEYREQGLCSLPLAFWKDGLSWEEKGFREFIHLGRITEKAWLSSALPPLGNELPKGSIFHHVSQSTAHQRGQSRSRAPGTAWEGLSKEPSWRAHPSLTPSYKPSNSALTGNSGGALIPKDKSKDLLLSHWSLRASSFLGNSAAYQLILLSQWKQNHGVEPTRVQFHVGGWGCCTVFLLLLLWTTGAGPRRRPFAARLHAWLTENKTKHKWVGGDKELHSIPPFKDDTENQFR